MLYETKQMRGSVWWVHVLGARRSVLRLARPHTQGVYSGGATMLALLQEVASGPSFVVAAPLYNSLGNIGGACMACNVWRMVRRAWGMACGSSPVVDAPLHNSELLASLLIAYPAAYRDVLQTSAAAAYGDLFMLATFRSTQLVSRLCLAPLLLPNLHVQRLC